MNCLLVVNTQSGNYTHLNIANIIARHTHPADSLTITRLTAKNNSYCAVGYDKVIVCGGDGTLYNALNVCHNTAVRHLVYVGCGTLNESCHSPCMRRQIGNISGTQFGYVLACGTLTNIGYATPNRAKKKVKALAYIGKILSNYKVHNIPVDIQTNNRRIRGRTSLVMFLHSNRCFGLPFNRMYDKEDNKLYMLVIASSGKDNLLGRIRLLLPMFRIFILGTNKPIHTRHICFDSIESADITLPLNTPCCIDGEQILLGGTHHISTQHPTYKLTIDSSMQ